MDRPVVQFVAGPWPAQAHFLPAPAGPGAFTQETATPPYLNPDPLARSRVSPLLTRHPASRRSRLPRRTPRRPRRDRGGGILRCQDPQEDNPCKDEC
jgi:hypothetical protein